MDIIQRNHEIFTLRQKGTPFSQIAIQVRLSPSRVKRIYENERTAYQIADFHTNGVKKDYNFYDTLVSVCETEAQATRIFRCFGQAGILEKFKKDINCIDSCSNEQLLKIKNFGPISLIFARQTIRLYKQKVLTQS